MMTYIPVRTRSMKIASAEAKVQFADLIRRA